jgi:hydroxysqualene dehydroxylase
VPADVPAHVPANVSADVPAHVPADVSADVRPDVHLDPPAGIAGAGRAVCVIGAGYAGMAAAVELADAGCAVTVLEAAPELGGRARRVHHRDTVLDNGLHIGIGAYTALLELGARVRGAAVPPPRVPNASAGTAQWQPEAGWLRGALDWRIDDQLHLRAPRWPAPWHLLGALAGARGLPLAARWDAVRLVAAMRRTGYRVDNDPTVEAWLARHHQGEAIVRLLWAPLCVAALNTPAERASAQVFANVLRDSLGAARSASDLLLPATDLSALFPDPAAVHVRERGGQVLCGCRVERIEPAADAAASIERVPAAPDSRGLRYRVVVRPPAAGPQRVFDALVLAVAPRALGELIGDWPELQPVQQLLAAYRFEPIASIYLQFPPQVRLAQPMLGFADGPGQWAFDRGQLTGQPGLIGVVISASAAQRALDGESLAGEVERQLAQRLPGLPRPLWSKVITEKLATFACVPGLLRPPTHTAAAGVFLAGDHVASDYPATLEGAVRSGQQAARAVTAYLQRGKPLHDPLARTDTHPDTPPWKGPGPARIHMKGPGPARIGPHRNSGHPPAADDRHLPTA